MKRNAHTYICQANAWLLLHTRFRVTRTTTRFRDSLGGRTGFNRWSYSGPGLITMKGYTAPSAEGQAHGTDNIGRKPGARFPERSPSAATEDMLDSSSRKLQQHVQSLCPPGKLIWVERPGFLWGQSPRHPLSAHTNIPDSEESKGLAM